MLFGSLNRLDDEIRDAYMQVIECDRRAEVSWRGLRRFVARASAAKAVFAGGLVATGWLLGRPRGRGGDRERDREDDRKGRRSGRHRRRAKAALPQLALRFAPMLLPLLSPLLDRRVASTLRSFGVPVTTREPRPLHTTPTLNLGEFAGTWFEIARLPGRGEIKAPTMFQYDVDEQGGLTVTERAVDAEGQPHERVGQVRPMHERHPGQLEATFAPQWLRWWPGAWHDHWVVYVDADYRCALLASPERDWMRLIAREPSMPDEAVQALMTLAGKFGFDTTPLQRTAPPARAA